MFGSQSEIVYFSCVKNISNLKEDTFVEWLYSGATIYKANIVKKTKFNNLNKGFNYLEDLYFSYNLTKKKFKHIVIAKATGKFT